ncbi:MAG: hypothetical protein KDK69_03040 [Chlamydiia bacterium]|nr:hypothetical protein [Chlamydiia bacterium]
MGTSKSFFAFLLVVVSGVGLWMGGKFLYDLHHYFLLSHTAPVHINEWKVEEIKPGKFSIFASLEFQVGERIFYKNYRFLKPVYQNPYVAEALIERWENERWEVWYNPKDPQIASLQKAFPIKAGVYFVLCLGVFLYFSWLRIYVRKMGGIDPH